MSNLKNEFSYKVFRMCLVIYGSYKFFQSFQVGAVRHAQSDSKQWVSYFSRMRWGNEVDFLHIIKYLYDLVHSHEYGQAHLVMSKVFPHIELAYGAWCYDAWAIILIFWIWVDIHRRNKLIQSFQFTSLVLEFWSQN